MTRRGFFDTLSQAVAWITGLAFVAPVAAYFFPKPSARGDNTLTNLDGEPIHAEDVVRQGSRTGLAFGEPTLVVHHQGEWKGFSAVCPHLGCIVRWQKAEGKILCPCHAARFDTDGNRISGPPPRGLTRYRVEVVENSVRLFEV